jgi:sugar lactone lactonase YvrE
MRPGSFQSSRTIHATYFNAGLRVYDITDASAPTEIACFVPPPAPGSAAIQFNDLTVTADGLIYATDRAGGGLYIIEPEIEFP